MVDSNANPADYEIGVERNGRIALPDDSLGGQIQVIYPDAIVRGSDIARASQSRDGVDRPNVSFELHPGGAQRFGRATTQNVGKAFAIVLDNRIVSAPLILSPITDGSGQITGSFTENEAQDLAAILSGGALSGPLTLVERNIR
jgi:preprotein translocase subunit SecD